ncbi:MULTISPECIES: isocitrate lyase/PEP mutase family protein [unclassified Sphingobium]|uniref:isocitrate lyase/PEP mutase family protein n=1 Tax=unclassified Sphingobium TaxID=2611147 RepID=UPI0009ECC4F8|nr:MULTISPECIES: isocitrate lyase/PEP mutase family protein [unclassified Sphingobium]NML91866.1 isocitrate lyase/PEP mutase family protein [Sphingobium sp. TB-6]
MMSAPARLRTLMAQGPVFAPGACDAFTARLIDRSGFGEALYLGGNALGLSLAKGQPLVTLTETAMHAAAIGRTSSRPLVVDAGAGFGDVPHVHRTIVELEQAGVAAIHIDDQPYPKNPGYHRGEGGIVAPELMADRLRVAASARRDPALTLIARTDTLREGASLEEAMARGRLYMEAGADALMILDLTPDRLAEVRRAMPDVPQVWIGGVVPPVPSRDDLAQAGFALSLYPFNSIAAIAQAVGDLWSRAASDGRIAQEDELLLRMRRELAEIAGMETYWNIADDLAGRPRRGGTRKTQ